MTKLYVGFLGFLLPMSMFVSIPAFAGSDGLLREFVSHLSSYETKVQFFEKLNEKFESELKEYGKLSWSIAPELPEKAKGIIEAGGGRENCRKPVEFSAVQSNGRLKRLFSEQKLLESKLDMMGEQEIQIMLKLTEENFYTAKSRHSFDVDRE